MIYWVAIALVLASTAIVDMAFRPTIRRVALRNLTHRTGEAALVVLGSALGTAIIAGAFIVGDTFDKSIRDIARTNLGPIDEFVELAEPDDLDAAVNALRETTIEGSDGVAGILNSRAAVIGVSTDYRSEPNARVSEVDFDDIRALGSEAGFDDAGNTPTNDEIVLNQDVADTTQVVVGDSVELYLYGTRVPFTVRDVVPDIGIGGFGDVFVAPGTLGNLSSAAEQVAVVPSALVLVSNEGAVFDSTDNSRDVMTRVGERLDDVGIAHEIDDAKKELLEAAEAEGDDITEIFTSIGGFSVLAGVLLLVNLFVMLAEERKTSLGILRAIGWKRSHLVRGFVVEGAAYGLVAAVLGALMGVPLGWLIVKSTSRIFASSDSDFTLLLAVEAKSVLLAGLVGFTIALAVSWATSIRISRMNIIGAIKDLPEPSNKKFGPVKMMLVALGTIGGAVLTVLVGVDGESPVALLAGVPIALFAMLPLMTRVLPERIASLGVGIVAIGWAIAVFTMFSNIMEDPPIPVFLLQGIVLVAGAVTITSSLGPVWSLLVAALRFGSSAGTTLGLAYPAARRFRTGISMAMFALIAFSLTFMAVLSAAFSEQTNEIASKSSAGFDALVTSNPANPVTKEALEERSDVTATATLLRAVVRFSGEFAPQSIEVPERRGLSGIDEDFAQFGNVPELAERDTAYASDVAAFEAVANDPSRVIVVSWFLAQDDDQVVSIGDEVTVSVDSGEKRAVTVAGIMNDDWARASTFVSAELVVDMLDGQYSTGQHYVKFSSGIDPEVASAQLTTAYVENGGEAKTFVSIVDEGISQQNGFFNLLSGYLALGLVIGVAGLSVVMVRAVRERRAQVGMLGAMGMSSRSIGTLFLVEGAFVAVQGVVAGVGLGLLSAYQLLTQSNTFEITLDFVVPWLVITAIALLPLVATALAIVVPARRAASMPVAEALRLTD